MKLRCSLECGVVIHAKPIENKDSASDANSYRISLFSSADENKELVGKDIPWPSQEQHPNELSYVMEDNSVVLKSPTTVAVIAVKLNSLFGGSSIVLNDNTRVYKSFSSNPVTSFNAHGLINALQKAIQNKESIKLWKTVLKELSSYDGQLCGVVPNSEQLLLLSVLDGIQDHSLLKELCSQFSSRRLFNYRYQEKFYTTCLELKFFNVLADTLESNTILPEQVFGHLLKYATSLPDHEGLKIVVGLLKKGFSETAMSLSGVSFNSTEFAMFVRWLRLIFSDNGKINLVDKLLSLLGSLIDANSSRLIWDSETHPHVLELMKDVEDMATLCDSYFNFEVERKKKHAVQEDSLPLYRLKKVELKLRKVAW